MTNTSLNIATTTAQTAIARILYCVPHASSALPHWLKGKGSDVLTTHEGYDIGAHDLAVALAKRTGGDVVAAELSRTVVDMNRVLNADAIPRFDLRGRAFAHNIAMTAGDLAARVNAWRIFHGGLGRAVEQAATGGDVLLCDTHSFTRKMGEGASRLVDIGVCLPESGDFGLRLLKALDALARSGRFTVQDENGLRAAVVRRDEPYPGSHPGAYIGRTYYRPGVDTVTLEVCDDLLRGPSAVDRVADLIAAAMTAASTSN